MKILTYDEALEKSDNKDWFKTFYKKEEIASDDECKLINSLASQNNQLLIDYFEDDSDILLQKEYVDDLVEYLRENTFLSI